MDTRPIQRYLIVPLAVSVLTSAALAGQYKVVKIVDGDTIDVVYKGKTERVRLLCVDTPESVHPNRSKNTTRGKQAAEYTRPRLEGRSVGLEFEKATRGKYGRLLAYVILDGQNFNVELVRLGWSPYYTKYGICPKYHKDFVGAENKSLTSAKKP